MASDGTAVARDASGRVVFVENALPGERVLVEILSERPKSAGGVVVRLLEPSLHRVDPPCPELKKGCGACPWQHVSQAAQRRLKEEIVLNAVRRGGTEPPSASPTVELEPWNFRTTIRTGVIDGQAGFRRSRSHDLIAVERCLIAHPLLEELLVGRRYEGVSEVLLRCGAGTGERMAATVPAGVQIDVPEDVHRRSIHEMAAGRSWRISAGSFFQTRADGVDALAAQVCAAAGQLGPPSTALDLYSGVGLFAGVLAERGWLVTAVESERSAFADAQVNLRDLPVQIVRADVTRWKPVQADLVVADPSRIGLGRQGVEVVRASGAARLILISCDAVSLGRDAALLGKQGYEMTGLTLVDLFAHTFHVEVVSIFDNALLRRPSSFSSSRASEA